MMAVLARPPAAQAARAVSQRAAAGGLRALGPSISCAEHPEHADKAACDALPPAGPRRWPAEAAAALPPPPRRRAASAAAAADSVPPEQQAAAAAAAPPDSSTAGSSGASTDAAWRQAQLEIQAQQAAGLHEAYPLDKTRVRWVRCGQAGVWHSRGMPGGSAPSADTTDRDLLSPPLGMRLAGTTQPPLPQPPPWLCRAATGGDRHAGSHHGAGLHRGPPAAPGGIPRLRPATARGAGGAALGAGRRGQDAGHHLPAAAECVAPWPAGAAGRSGGMPSLLLLRRCGPCPCMQ